MTEQHESRVADERDVEEADADRQHPQDPAEGPDADAGDDVPRVHPEDPAEG